MLLNPFTYHAPKTESEAAQLIANLADAKLIAGGTLAINILKSLKRNHSPTPSHVISLKKVTSIQGITLKDDKLLIGAMTKISDIIDSTIIGQYCPVLSIIGKNIATTQIKNMATIGGNITARFVWTDFQVPLVALGCDLHFLLKDDQQRIISAQDFFDQGARSQGLLTKISFKIPSKNEKFIYQRVPKRSKPDFPMFSMCFKYTVDNKRLTKTKIVMNDSCHFAKRIPSIEQNIDGLDLTSKTKTNILNKLDLSAVIGSMEDYKKTRMLLSFKDALQQMINAHDNESKY